MRLRRSVKMLARRVQFARRALANSQRRRTFVGGAFGHATGIPVGARAQVLVAAVAPHRPGASKEIAEVLFEQGASSACSLKETNS